LADHLATETPNKVIHDPRKRLAFYAVILAVAVCGTLATLITAGVLSMEQVQSWGDTFLLLLPWLVSLATAALAIVNVPKREQPAEAERQTWITPGSERVDPDDGR
jgi:hypothetical protein